MRAPRRLRGLLVAGLLLAAVDPASTPAGAAEPCRLRLANLSADLPTLRFELRRQPAGAGAEPAAVELGRNRASDPVDLPPARYEARLASGGEPVGSIVFGCDPDGRYTLAAFGRDPRGADREPGWLDRLREAFGGVETRTTRGDLLQPSLLRDAVVGRSDSASLRAVHAAPGIAPLSIEARRDGEAAAVADGLRYAAAGTPVDLPPGRHRIEVRHAGARRPLVRAWLDAERGRAYTLYLVPAERPGAPVDLLVLPGPK